MLLFCLAKLAFGDVEITSPGEGQSYKATTSGLQITIEWKDDGNSPTLDTAVDFVFALCYGLNSEINCNPISSYVKSDELQKTSDGYSYEVTIPVAQYANGQYYFKVAMDLPNQGYTNHYSPRFSLSNMQGTTPNTVTDSGVPSPQTSTANQNTATSIDTRSFTVPYTMQTGIWRYAPMQMQPPTKVTKSTWSTRFPKSSVTYYTSLRASLDHLSTITPGWSYTYTSDFNYASHAPMPSDNGGWYDPKSKLTLTARKTNA